MKTLADILPLHANQILIQDWKGHYAIKRLVRRAGETPTSFTQAIHGAAVKTLKKRGYRFLPDGTWPWNDEGVIEGKNPSWPASVHPWGAP